MSKTKLDYRYYVTQDGKRLVKEGDPEAYALQFRAGDEISQEEADKWDLHKPAPKLDKPESTKVLKPEIKEAPKSKEGK